MNLISFHFNKIRLAFFHFLFFIKKKLDSFVYHIQRPVKNSVGLKSVIFKETFFRPIISSSGREWIFSIGSVAHWSFLFDLFTFVKTKTKNTLWNYLRILPTVLLPFEYLRYPFDTLRIVHQSNAPSIFIEIHFNHHFPPKSQSFFEKNQRKCSVCCLCFQYQIALTVWSTVCTVGMTFWLFW